VCLCPHKLSRTYFPVCRSEPGPYEDTVGPLVLALLLMGAIVMNFGVKLYDMYSRQ
jgi:hypothetical protein